jgi:hypothetical protein
MELKFGLTEKNERFTHIECVFVNIPNYHQPECHGRITIFLDKEEAKTWEYGKIYLFKLIENLVEETENKE